MSQQLSTNHPPVMSSQRSLLHSVTLEKSSSSDRPWHICEDHSLEAKIWNNQVRVYGMNTPESSRFGWFVKRVTWYFWNHLNVLANMNTVGGSLRDRSYKEMCKLPLVKIEFFFCCPLSLVVNIGQHSTKRICVVCAVQKSINGLLAEHVNQFSIRCCDLWQAKQLSLASPPLQNLPKGTEHTVDLQPMRSPLFLLATRWNVQRIIFHQLTIWQTGYVSQKTHLTGSHSDS